MRILVTGSSGFLGSAMVTTLRAMGCDTYGVDLVPSIYTDWVGDIRDWIGENREPNFDHVIHMAGVVGGREGIEYNYFGIAGNIDVDRVVFEWVMKHDISHLVYPSSSAVYPTKHQSTNGVKLCEGMVSLDRLCGGGPDHIYGWYKLTAERLLHEFRNTNTRVSIIRPFSGYGPNQSLDYPFPSLIDKVKNNTGGVVNVWGSGKQVRDFVHVDDIMSTIKWLCVIDVYSRVLNISTGIGTSMNDLIHTISDVGDFGVSSIEPVLSKPVGVQYRVGDTEKQAGLGILPCITLRDGIETMLR